MSCRRREAERPVACNRARAREGEKAELAASFTGDICWRIVELDQWRIEVKIPVLVKLAPSVRRKEETLGK